MSSFIINTTPCREEKNIAQEKSVDWLQKYHGTETSSLFEKYAVSPDYISSRHIYAPGETNKTINFSIIDDELREQDEKYEAKITTDNEKVDIPRETARVTIIDDEGDTFRYDTTITVTDPDNGPMTFDAEARGDVEKLSRRKYIVRAGTGFLTVSPDPLGLSGGFFLDMISLEFKEDWNVKNLIFNFTGFPASPIPGPHLFMQMLIAFHSRNGDLFTQLAPREYQWRPDNMNIYVESETDKSITLSLTHLFTDTGYQQNTDVRITIQK